MLYCRHCLLWCDHRFIHNCSLLIRYLAHTTELYNCVAHDFLCRAPFLSANSLPCSTCMWVCGEQAANLITCLSWCWQGAGPVVLKWFITVTVISDQSGGAVCGIDLEQLRFSASTSSPLKGSYMLMLRVTYNNCLWRQALGTICYKVLCISNTPSICPKITFLSSLMCPENNNLSVETC